jgi:3-phosphoshikimate 1-carboxyvinyltransferase
MVISPLQSIRPLKGTVSVPGDKSLAHRAVLFAALAEGKSEVGNYPDSGVTRAMRGALESLGVPSSLKGDVLCVKGNGLHPFPNSGATAYCGNSATTIRLLAGAVAATRSAAVLDGSEGLRKRPMDRIAEPLRRMGAKIECVSGCAPLRIGPAELHGIGYDLPVASAQVLSCLQIAGLGAKGESRFVVNAPVRDHTSRMLKAMGAPVVGAGREVFIEGLEKPLKPLHGLLPGDISSATFLFAAAAIVSGSEITVTGVGVNHTRTGILDVLSKMGAKVKLENKREAMGEPVADVTLAAAPLRAVKISGDLVVRSIDELPAIAAIAAFAEGCTEVREAKELRYKETDRIAAIVTQLRALGTDVEEFEDGFAVQGGTLTGGIARANGDHRLAMSMALCGLRAPVSVEGAEILNESFPGFVSTLDALRA